LKHPAWKYAFVALFASAFTLAAGRPEGFHDLVVIVSTLGLCAAFELVLASHSKTTHEGGTPCP
jgi:hypothetical protein